MCGLSTVPPSVPMSEQTFPPNFHPFAIAHSTFRCIWAASLCSSAFAAWLQSPPRGAARPAAELRRLRASHEERSAGRAGATRIFSARLRWFFALFGRTVRILSLSCLDTGRCLSCLRVSCVSQEETRKRGVILQRHAHAAQIRKTPRHFQNAKIDTATPAVDVATSVRSRPLSADVVTRQGD